MLSVAHSEKWRGRGGWLAKGIRAGMGIGLLCVACVAILWMQPCWAAEGLVAEAEALERYARTLAKTGEITVPAPAGLTFKGEALAKTAVLRPMTALSRAADLFMEAAAESNDPALVDRALKIWADLEDSKSPVGYLRSYMLTKKEQNPDFAAHCTVRLANCYIAQGDWTSAKSLLLSLIKTDSAIAKDHSALDVLYLSKATYAECLLFEKDIDEARKMALEVLDKAPRADSKYSPQVGDAYNVAVKIIASIPAIAVINKKSNVNSTEKERALLKELEGDIQKYFQLGNIAMDIGDSPKAIRYWEEYRKRFPTGIHASAAAMGVAKAWEKAKNHGKAIDAYRSVVLQYPESDEAWEAAARAVKLLVQERKTKEAFSLLEQAGRSIKTAHGRAWVLERQAQLFSQNRMPDEAAEKYIGLLIKYGDQDAAKEAVANLQKTIPQVKKWKNFAQFLQSWFSGRYGRVGQVGNTQLTLGDASQLRRLVLAFYIENNETNNGVTWLKTAGLRSEEKDRNWLLRDEAWFYAQCVQKIISSADKTTKQEMSNITKLGLTSWKLAPETAEGLGGLQAATALMTTPNIDQEIIRQFIRDMEKLRGGNNDAVITEMLLRLYEGVGDEKKLKALQNETVKL